METDGKGIVLRERARKNVVLMEESYKKGCQIDSDGQFFDRK